SGPRRIEKHSELTQSLFRSSCFPLRPGRCVEAFNRAVHQFAQPFAKLSFVGDLAIAQGFADGKGGIEKGQGSCFLLVAGVIPKKSLNAIYDGWNERKSLQQLGDEVHGVISSSKVCGFCSKSCGKSVRVEWAQINWRL